MRYDEIIGESRGEVFKKLQEKHGSNAVLIKIYEKPIYPPSSDKKNGFFSFKKKKPQEPKKVWVGQCGIPETQEDWQQLEEGYQAKKNTETQKPPLSLQEEKTEPLKTQVQEETNPLSTQILQQFSKEFLEMKLLLNQMTEEKEEPLQEEKNLEIFKNYLLKNDFSLDFSNHFIQNLTVPSVSLDAFEIILKEKLRIEIPTLEGLPLKSGQFIMLMGPTGVGKTTSLAKLAAIYYQNNFNIRFLTFDSYRLGAARQLEMYANIFEKPFSLVQNKKEMEAFLKSLKEDEVVFIDTAGESMTKDIRLNEVNDFLKLVPQKVIRILVIPALGKSSDILKIKAKFKAYFYDYYIITKLDETLHLGGVFSSLYKDSVPVVYTTFGQEVPEDIEKADIEKLLAYLKKE